MKKLILIIAGSIFSLSSFGQHQHHPPPKEPVKKEQKKPVAKKQVVKKKTVLPKLVKDSVQIKTKDTIPVHDHMKMDTILKADTLHTGHDHQMKMDTVPKVDTQHTG